MPRPDRHVNLVNLTGHPMTFIAGEDYRVIRSVGKARVESRMEMIERVMIDDIPYTIPLLEITETAIANLPPRETGTLYVVSGIVSALAQRHDVVAPSRVVRDDEGRVVGCRALSCVVNRESNRGSS